MVGKTMKNWLSGLFVAGLTFTQIPLTGEVFAQEPGSVDTSSSSLTLADELSQIVPESKPEPWYKSERISGRVEMGDFVVGPGRSEVTAKPGETVYAEISVTNRISDDRAFSLEVEDIEGAQDGSSMVTLGSERKSPRGLVDFITFPETTIELDLGERARIPVAINVPSNASPGGYYGAVLVSTVRISDAEDDDVPRSPLIARVASLIFLTVEGDIVESGETLSIDTINDDYWGLWHEKGPIDMGILFENTGTIHLGPYGTVSIHNILGEEVGYLEIEPWFVLPNGLRLREFSWDREFLFGRYTVEAQMNRGYRNGQDVIDTVSTTFWVLPWRLVGSIFLGLFIIIFLIRTFFRKFEFKRKD